MKNLRSASRLAIACFSVLVALSACSSTGGKPRETASGMGAGQADTPRFTVAMITHGPPGDSFWDLIRKGAETAAKVLKEFDPEVGSARVDPGATFTEAFVENALAGVR